MVKKLIFNISKTKAKKIKNLQCKIISENKLWSKDEDEILIKVSKFMKRNKWKYTSSILSNKTPLQCYLRYKLINPLIKKGRWLPQEDQKLKELVDLFGKSWKLISKIMKNRSSKQIRNRYEDHLDETLNKQVFNKEEDEKILKIIKEKTQSRVILRQMFPFRSLKMINNRIMYLKKKGCKAKKYFKDSFNKNNILEKNNNTINNNNFQKNNYFCDPNINKTCSNKEIMAEKSEISEANIKNEINYFQASSCESTEVVKDDSIIIDYKKKTTIFQNWPMFSFCENKSKAF